MKVRDLIIELLDYNPNDNIELSVDGQRVDIEEVRGLYSNSDTILIHADTRDMTLQDNNVIKEWKDKADLYDDIKDEEEVG